MRVAVRTIDKKNKEIQVLKDQITAGENDPSLAAGLASVESERDAARAEMVGLTTQLNNVSGVVDGSLLGSLLVSLTAEMNSMTSNIVSVTADLRGINV